MAKGVSASGEFALIDAFLEPFGLDRSGLGSKVSGVRAGPGDDCAQLLPSKGQVLVATTDAVVDGVHFDLKRCGAYAAGWKALAVNLSDLAAAGARPRWILCALGVPPSKDAQAIAGAMGQGMADLLSQSGAALVGGNVTRSPRWSLTITALGEATAPLTRTGGRPGDALVVVGTLGAAALGLRLQQSPRWLQQRRRPKAARFSAAELEALGAQHCPLPLNQAGQLAAGLARASIDVSDGLLQDLGHLCQRSGCGAVLDCALLPRGPAVVAAEAEDARGGAHPYALSLTGGEDYALLLAVPPAAVQPLLAALAAAATHPRYGVNQRYLGTVIGRLVRGAQVRLTEGKKRLQRPARGGFDHLG